MGNTDSSFTLLELFNLGGIFMWPLLFFSIAATAIALERAFYIFYHNLRLDDLYDTVRRYVEKNDIPGAWQYLKSLSRRRLGARFLLVFV
jgi:biopolymer transport protein ExbB